MYPISVGHKAAHACRYASVMAKEKARDHVRHTYSKEEENTGKRRIRMTTVTGQEAKAQPPMTIDEAYRLSDQDIRKANRFRKWGYYPAAVCMYPLQFVFAAISKRATENMLATKQQLDYKKYQTGELASTKRSRLGRSLTLPNGQVVRNRLIKAGITDGLCDFMGNPTENSSYLYRRYGRGGWGMIISPSTSVDRDACDPSVGNAPILDEQSDLESYRKLASAMKESGSIAILQLSHPGPLVAYNQRAVAPGPFISRSGRNVLNRACEVLTENEIEEILNKFQKACQLAEQAGFDGVQILSANGYLGSTFMSKDINTRTDKWKGDTFVVELMTRLLQSRQSPNFTIGIKINSSDLQRGGLTQDEALATMRTLSRLKVDFFEIGGGTYQHMDTRYSVTKLEGPSRGRESFFIDFAEKVTACREITTPILAVGGWKDVAAMASAVEQNPSLMIGFGRASAVDPELAKKIIATDLTHIPDWFQHHLPDWIAEKQKSEKRDERSIAYAVEMLWYGQNACSLANGDTAPKTAGLFTNPLEALVFKVQLFIKGFLPRDWLGSFYRDHPLRKPLREKGE